MQLAHMLACRRPSTLLRKLRPSSRAGFQSSPASAGARQTTPRTTIKEDPQPHAYYPQPPPSHKPTRKPSTSPRNTHPRPPRGGPPVPPEPSKKLINAPLAGALAVALVFGYFASVSFLKPASATDPSSPDGHVPSDPLYHKPSSSPADARDVPTGRPTSFTGISAAEFDRELDREEYRTGVAKLRKMLAGRAVGHVLEVAVGTGRNFDLYNWDTLAGVSPAPADAAAPATKAAEPKGKKGQQPAEEAKPQMLSFTGVDIATDMLDVAAAKLKNIPALSEAVKDPSITVLRDGKNQVAAGAIEYLSGAIRLVKANALSFIPPAPPTTSPQTSPAQTKAQKQPLAQSSDAKYDTVIQTFGLCSVSSPQEILASLSSLVKPDTGRILLLEHGRGTWSLVNWWLDRHAPEHFRKYGCWWNRDLEAVVRDAARESAGGKRLEVVKVERPGYQGGTVLWIELRVVEG